MPNAWQDYAALIFVFYNRIGIISFAFQPELVFTLLPRFFIGFVNHME